MFARSASGQEGDNLTSARFFCRNALSRQHRFVYGKSVRLDQPSVCHRFVSRTEKHHVPAHDVFLCDHERFAPADDADADAIVNPAERLKRLCRASFHKHGKKRGKKNGDEDPDALERVAAARFQVFSDIHPYGHRPGKLEDDKRRLAKRVRKTTEKALLLFFRQFVYPVFRTVFRNEISVKTPLFIRVKAIDRFFRTGGIRQKLSPREIRPADGGSAVFRRVFIRTPKPVPLFRRISQRLYRLSDRSHPFPPKILSLAAER